METLSYTIGTSDAGIRLDRALADKLKDRSRTFIQKLIDDNCVKINGIYAAKASIQTRLGDTIDIYIPAVRPLGALPLPQKDMGVKIMYEHEDFLIVYKPAGLVVHAPSPYSTEVSLVDWLVHSFKDLHNIGTSERPGIVHRLDKDTSGILIIPRMLQAHAQFSLMFQERRIEKTYLAIVKGHPLQEGHIDLPLGRHPIHRHKISVVPHGRAASTRYKVITYLDKSALLEVYPHTGRTHQIRVHCAAKGYPIIGDELYGSSSDLIKRQALHAYQLGFMYKEQWYSFTYQLPLDMQNALEKLTL